MKKINTFILFLALITLSACSTQTAVIQSGESKLASDQMQHFFVSGLGQTQTIDAASTCGGSEKVAKVERTLSPLNWILSVLTSNIYTPMDAKVYCTP